MRPARLTRRRAADCDILTHITHITYGDNPLMVRHAKSRGVKLLQAQAASGNAAATFLLDAFDDADRSHRGGAADKHRPVRSHGGRHDLGWLREKAAAGDARAAKAMGTVASLFGGSQSAGAGVAGLDEEPDLRHVFAAGTQGSGCVCGAGHLELGVDHVG